MPRAERLLMVILSMALGMAAPAIADEQSATRLNSERIEQRFGSYGIEVLSQSENLRIASLYSIERGEPVTRTFAVTRYADAIGDRLGQVHQRILGGSSIGATLAEEGWTVERHHLWTGDLPATSKVTRLMHLPGPTRLAVHLFDLEITRGSESLIYATIAEVHHPEYLDQAGVERLFGRIDAANGEQAASMLQLTVKSMLDGASERSD
jgi:hypothetical protein